MANSNDIQALMSTKISVDSAQANDNVTRLTSGFKELTASWKAEQAVAKANGDVVKAAEVRYKGLSDTLDVQKLKLEQLQARRQALKSEMESSAVVTKDQTSEMKVLDKQLSSTARSVASLSKQQERAKHSFEYVSSGLKDLRNEYYTNNRAIDANVAKLEAQGHSAEAQKVKLAGLKESLANLAKQESATQKLADKAAESEGKQSNLYLRRKTDLDKVSRSIAETKSQIKSMESTMQSNTGWSKLKRDLFGVSGAEKQVADNGHRIRDIFTGAFLSNIATNALTALQTHLTGIVETGYKVAQAGAALQSRWKNIGLSANGVKQLSNQVTDLKTNTYLTAQTVNSLQARFYGMTHSVSQTKILTKGVASLSDQLKLSDQQANAFAGGLSRIESSGKVTRQSLGRLEKQAPNLTTAMANASGMSRKAFQDLVASGKMTADQFNQILAKSSQDYDKNAKAFGQSSDGAMHKLRAEWTNTQAKMAKPLLKVSSTGLNELSKALNDKSTQKGLQIVAKGMATIAVESAKGIAVLSKYHKVVLPVVGVFVTLVGAIKAARIAMAAFDVIADANPLGLMVAGIVVATAALTALYVWINKLVKTKKFKAWAKSLGQHWNSFAKTMRNGIRRGANAITKGLSGIIRHGSNFFKRMERSRQQYDRQMTKAHQQSMRENQRTWNTISRNTAKASKSMWNRASRDARNGWNYIVRWGGRSTKNIVRGWDQMSRSTAKIAQQMFRNHRQTFVLGYKVLQDRTRTWHDVMTGHWDRLSSDTQRTSRDMSRYHHAIFRDMYNRLNNLTDGRLGDMVKSWQSKMGSIGDTVANAKKAIHDHFVDLVRGIIQPFNDMLEDLHKGINWVLEKVGASTIGGTWSVPMPSYAVGTPGTHPGGLAKVNDAPTSHYRELYRLPNGKMGMFPAVRNMILPLPAGTSVLDGERSYQLSRMMGIIPHYADGTLDAVGNFFSNLKDSAEDFMDNTEKFLKHPIEFMESVFKKFVKVSTPVQFATNLVQHVPVFIAKNMVNWVKKQLEVFSNPGGAGVERWRSYIIRAFNQLGLKPVAWKVEKLLRQIWTESKGNPLAFQHGYTDANSGGNEARGLLQFAKSTWAADALPGHTDWRNGYNEILAAIAVLERGGEGGWGNVGNGHGWANGGLVTTHGLYEVAERNKPEFIIPTDITRRDRAYQLLGQLMTRFRADDPRISTLGSDTGNLKNVEKKMDTMIGLLSELLGSGNATVQAIKNQGSLDVKRLYKRQALDASMRAFS
jgi:tape measure domain-containing protein